MSANGFKPPDLILILKSDTVHFIGTILLQQAAKPLYAFSCRMNIGKGQINDILFPDAASFLFPAVSCRLINN